MANKKKDSNTRKEVIVERKLIRDVGRIPKEQRR
jgi:hypothetical protein